VVSVGRAHEEVFEIKAFAALLLAARGAGARVSARG
jgi:hypothetical protein